MGSKNTIPQERSTQKRALQYIERNCFAVCAIILTAIVWLPMSTYCQEWLIRIESKSLFLYDLFFIKESIQQPIGLLNYSALFLTQFLHIPWLGALIFCSLLVISAYLTKKVYDIEDKDSYLAFLPSVLMVILNICTGYALYIIKSPGFFFAPAIGYTVSVFAMYCIKMVKSPVLSIPLIIVWTILGYLGFGIYALASTMAIAIIELKRESAMSSKISFVLFSSIFVIFTPLFTSFISTTYNGFAAAFTAAAPTITEPHNFPLYKITAVLLVSLPIVFSICYRPISSLFKKQYYTVQISAMLIYCIAICLFWFKDANFYAEQKISNAVDNLDWKLVADTHKEIAEKHKNKDNKIYNKMVSKTNNAISTEETASIVDKYKSKIYEPSRMMVLLKDLALVKLGKESNTAFTYKDGGRVQKFQSTIPIVSQCGKQLYLHYGLPNLAYRWCIEEAVEYGWNSETLKYAAKASILTGDFKLAQKFIDQLKKTLFHKEWAEDMSAYIKNPELIDNSAEMQSIKDLMCYESELSNDRSVIETYLLDHFTKNRGANATPYFDRVAMLWALHTQDIPTFWICFNNYLTTNNPTEMPRHYQEATLLYGNLEKNVDISKMPFDKSVVTTFNNFNRYTQQNRVSNLDLASYSFAQNFGNTFYYYYYFIRNLNTY
jgi:membrane protein DedA with SNARE-associated domain